LTGSRGWSSPHWHYETEPETRAALELISSDHFNRNEPGVFAPLRDTLLTRGDIYMGVQGGLECGPLWDVLKRPHDRRVCGWHLKH
jgi:hypothetical protein